MKHPLPKVSFGLKVINFIVQRIFRINTEVPWMVHYTSKVSGVDKIIIGKEVEISFCVSGGCYIQGGNGIIIGDYSIFAPGVKIISADHDQRDLQQWLPAAPIKIGKHCWIGANAVLLPGVELGDHCTVGAGSVVTRKFPAGSVIVGVPGETINAPAAEHQNTRPVLIAMRQ